MTSFNPDSFIKKVREQVRLFISLLIAPERTWILLRESDPDPKHVYYFLIIPLCILLGLVTFVFQFLFDGFYAAGMYFLIESGITVLTIYTCAAFVFFLNMQSGAQAFAHEVQATAPYIFVPWLIAAIISNIFGGILPLLGDIAGVLLYLAATIIGASMLYRYTVHYLEIQVGKRVLFFVLAFVGIIVFSFLVSVVEADLVLNFVMHGA
jgi:hypothetical protein